MDIGAILLTKLQTIFKFHRFFPPSSCSVLGSYSGSHIEFNVCPQSLPVYNSLVCPFLLCASHFWSIDDHYFVFLVFVLFCLLSKLGVHCCRWASHCWWLLLLIRGSRCLGSVVVVHKLSCPVACGFFQDQGLNPYPLNWQVNSAS